jgi:hypothetical protein
MIVSTLTRDSVTRMPLLWRIRLVEVINARAEAKAYKDEQNRAAAEREAHSNGYVLGNRNSWR